MNKSEKTKGSRRSISIKEALKISAGIQAIGTNSLLDGTIAYRLARLKQEVDA